MFGHGNVRLDIPMTCLLPLKKGNLAYELQKYKYFANFGHNLALKFV